MAYQLSNRGFVDSGNSSAVALAGGATYTGTGIDVSAYPSVVVSVLTDAAGTCQIQFSTDNSNWDSTLSFSVAANTNEVHCIRVTRKYFRVRYTNGAAAQTAFRLQSIVGSQGTLTSSLNSIIPSDADATIVRPLDFNMMVSEGLYQNRVATIKDGINFDIDAGSTPEDITNEGGIYAGFPTGAPELAQIVVAGADTGTVYYSYMASPADTDYTFGSLAITGAGTYALGHNIWRCNFAYFLANSPTATNVGDITIRNTPTTANVFCVIPAGYGQTYCAAYTVPANSFIVIDRITAEVLGSTTGQANGFFYYRPSVSTGYYLRFPFSVQFGTLYFDDVDYLTRIPAGVDLIPRITSASANNLQIKVSYRFVKTS